jgi:hypothetical protein
MLVRRLCVAAAFAVVCARQAHADPSPVTPRAVAFAIESDARMVHRFLRQARERGETSLAAGLDRQTTQLDVLSRRARELSHAAEEGDDRSRARAVTELGFLRARARAVAREATALLHPVASASEQTTVIVRIDPVPADPSP